MQRPNWRFASTLFATLSLTASAEIIPEMITLDGHPAPEGTSIPQGAEDTYELGPLQRPTLTLFRTEQDPAKGTFLIFPGGSYANIMYKWEGTVVAEYFNQMGYDAAVATYRVRMGDETRSLALEDALQQWELITTQTKELDLSDKRFGIIGFSAGGHLSAVLVQTLAEQGKPQPDDLVLAYAAYLALYSPERGFNKVSPPKNPTSRLYAIVGEKEPEKWLEGMKNYVEAWAATGGEYQFTLLDCGHGFRFKRMNIPSETPWPQHLFEYLDTNAP